MAGLVSGELGDGIGEAAIADVDVVLDKVKQLELIADVKVGE